VIETLCILGQRKWLSGIILASFVLDSGLESQRGRLFFGILPRGEISQEGFSQRLVSSPATSRYRGSMRIISEALLVCPNGYLISVKKKKKKDRGWSFIT
jgi:hypothetical protein